MHGKHCVCYRKLDDLHMLAVVSFMPHIGQTASKEYLYAFIRVANAGMHGGDVPPRARQITGLLTQFAAGGIKGMLRWIDFPGRQLKKNPPQWITKLTFEEQFAVVKESNNHNCSRMGYPFPEAFLSVRHTDSVATNLQQHTVKNRLTVNLGFNQVFVFHVSAKKPG